MLLQVNDGESSRASTGARQSTAKKRHRQHKAKREASPPVITVPSKFGFTQKICLGYSFSVPHLISLLHVHVSDVIEQTVGKITFAPPRVVLYHLF